MATEDSYLARRASDAGIVLRLRSRRVSKLKIVRIVELPESKLEDEFRPSLGREGSGYWSRQACILLQNLPNLIAKLYARFHFDKLLIQRQKHPLRFDEIFVEFLIPKCLPAQREFSRIARHVKREGIPVFLDNLRKWLDLAPHGNNFALESRM